MAALVVVPYGQGAIGWFSLAAIVAAVVLVRVGKWYSRQLAHVRAVSGAMDSEGCGLSRKTIRRAMAMLIVLMFSKHFYIACINSYFTFFLIGKFGVSVQASQFCLFAFLAASAVGTVAGGFLGDRFGRKYVIWGSILGAAPFALALPYTGLQATIVLSIVIGLVISSAFSAILVYATDLMPGKVGMIAGIFFGLSFGLGGIGSAFFGWLADRTGVGFIFRISSFLPLLGVVAGFLPDLRSGSR